MAKFILSAFADEASPMLDEQIKALQEEGVSLIELRGGVPAAMTMGMSGPEAIAVCSLGNMLPVPFIYLFARKVLLWGSTKPHIGPVFSKILDKGEKAGQKLVATASRKGLFVALMADWRIALILVAVFGIVYFATRYVSLGSVLGAAVFSICFAVFHFSHISSLSSTRYIVFAFLPTVCFGIP